MKFYILLFLFAAFSLHACTQGENQSAVTPVKKPSADSRLKGIENLGQSAVMKDIICQTWEYKEDAAAAKELDVASHLDIVYRGYSFFKDSTVVKDPRGNLRTGKWEIDEKAKPVTIKLTFDKGEKETSQLAYLSPYGMTLVSTASEQKKKINLISEGIRHINLKDDPFYIDNVLWRIKPASPETGEAIKQRLKSCIHFFVLFYDQKINARSASVTFVGLPSCFNWHAGGIYLQSKTELQKKWTDCFFNSEQAMKAYDLADKLLSKKYDWPKKESNWLKLNVAVLRQMESNVDLIR